MRRSVFLLLNCFLTVSMLEAADLIANRSPEGRFGLLLKESGVKTFDGGLIEIRPQKTLLELGSFSRQSFRPNYGCLLWSPDSRRVAYYTGGRKGGDTSVYFLSGSKFVKIRLPEWPTPELKHERITSTDLDDVWPLRWSASDTLVLKRDWVLETESTEGKGEDYSESDAGETITLHFDSQNNASIRSVQPMSSQALKAANLVEAGQDRQTAGYNSEAIADFDAAIKLDPTNADAYSGRGDIRQEKDDNDGAIADYSRVIELTPIAAYGAWVGRGDAKQAKGDNDGAIADYDRAIDLSPLDATAYHSRGDAKQAKGDNDGAIADYDRAVEFGSGDAAVYNGRGIAKQAKDDNDGAIADYSRAIQLDADASYYYNRGTANFAKRDWTHALTDLRRSRELNQDDKDSPVMVWIIQARGGDKAAADAELATDMEKQLSGEPDDWSSKIASFLLEKLSETDLLAAAANSREADTKRDQTCDAWYYAGMKRLLAGDKSAAIDNFHNALATQATTENEYQFAGSELKALTE